MAADGRRRRFPAPVGLALIIALTAASHTPSRASDPGDVLRALEERGLSRAALQIPWNIVDHDPFTPRSMPEAVRRGLLEPLLVPTLAEAVCGDAVEPRPPRMPLPPDAWIPPLAVPPEWRRRLAWYVREVEALSHALAEHVDLDLAHAAAAEIAGRGSRWRSASVLAEQAGQAFLADIAARFRAAQAGLGALPATNVPVPLRFTSPIGDVAIGTSGADVHPADAALIIDPGGDDVYRRRALTGGVSVIVDLGGDDSYFGDDVAIGGLSAILDLSGDDSYRATGSAFAAAVGGVALLLDRAGDDRYEVGVFGLGAAVAGMSLLVDGDGADRYRIRARGQGFAGPGGRACLWDRGGVDRYEAEGLPDPHGRPGALVSQAQGAATGDRRVSAGGIGVLRDDGGDDRYEAQMFAQGAGYYFGLGALIDAGGDDLYTAARYAQGQGTHGGIGYLGDQAGDDAYALSVGVGQGMGLDTGIGILRDRDGKDLYEAPNIAQGASTGNGLGLLEDGGGADRYRLMPPGDGWGRGRPDRGLPGLAFLIDHGRDGKAWLGDSLFAKEIEPGGPMAGEDAELGPAPVHACPSKQETSPRGTAPLLDLLRSAAPVFGDGPAALAAHHAILAHFPNNLSDLIGALPPDDVGAIASLRNVGRCALAGGDRAAYEAVEKAMNRELSAGPLSWKVGLLLTMAGYAGADLPAKLIERIARAHPDCGARTLALKALRPVQVPAALLAQAETSSCWQERALAVQLSGAPVAKLPWQSDEVRPAAPPADAERAGSR